VLGVEAMSRTSSLRLKDKEKMGTGKRRKIYFYHEYEGTSSHTL
jgi:hypothetical protein